MTIGSVSGVRTPRATAEWTTLASPMTIAASTSQLFAVVAASGFPEMRAIVVATMANAAITPVTQRTVWRQPGPMRLPTNSVIGMLIVYVTIASKYSHRSGAPPIVARTGGWDASSRATHLTIWRADNLARILQDLG